MIYLHCQFCGDAVEVVWKDHNCWVCHWTLVAMDDDVPPFDGCLWHSSVQARHVRRWWVTANGSLLIE